MLNTRYKNKPKNKYEKLNMKNPSFSNINAIIFVQKFYRRKLYFKRKILELFETEKKYV